MVLCTFQKNYYRWLSQHPVELSCVVCMFVMIPLFNSIQSNPELHFSGINYRNVPVTTALTILGSLILLLKLLFFVFQPRCTVLRWQDEALYLGHRPLQFGAVDKNGTSVRLAQSAADRMLTLKLNADADPYSYRLNWFNQAGILKASAKGYIADIPAPELILLLAGRVHCTVSQETPVFRGTGSSAST
jgi:hypothetical protein